MAWQKHATHILCQLVKKVHHMSPLKISSSFPEKKKVSAMLLHIKSSSCETVSWRNLLHHHPTTSPFLLWAVSCVMKTVLTFLHGIYTSLWTLKRVETSSHIHDPVTVTDRCCPSQVMTSVTAFSRCCPQVLFSRIWTFLSSSRHGWDVQGSETTATTRTDRVSFGLDCKD